MSQINIEEKETIYGITLTYHSDRKCQNYDAIMTGVEESDGSMTVRPWGSDNFKGSFFEFNHSDPDRVIAIAQMMLAFAQMVKNKNNNPIDTDANA